jgi:creatinine amidohydrolase
MRVADLNWMQLASYFEHDDRAVLPVGSTEQHAYLSLSTDSILAERVAAEAADPLGLPVFPVMPYGITPAFRAYPGSVTLSARAFGLVVREILDGLHDSGARRILIVNGHGGNMPLRDLAAEWAKAHPGTRAKVHDWWKGPCARAKVDAIDPVASHASWMENFPWTRLPGIAVPAAQRPMVDLARVRALDPVALRAYLGDGNYGGLYQRSDEDMLALWHVAVEETRALLTGSWGDPS